MMAMCELDIDNDKVLTLDHLVGCATELTGTFAVLARYFYVCLCVCECCVSLSIYVCFYARLCVCLFHLFSFRVRVASTHIRCAVSSCHFLCIV